VIKLIAWMVAVYALYQLWRGRAATGRGQINRSARRSRRDSSIDRSEVVDAEFTDVDKRDEPLP
jgi:hypothetical protein